MRPTACHLLPTAGRAWGSYALLLHLFLAGCSTHAHRLASPRQDFYSNHLESAEEKFSKLTAQKGRDQSVIELDLALVELLKGKATAAERRLRTIRDQWDHLEQQSLAEETTSLLTDDQRRAYAGEDYEKIMLRVFLTLASLMSDGVDAESYSLQTLDKHQQLVEKRGDESEQDPAYCIPPIAPYLRGVLREATLSNYDDALRSYQVTASLLPEPNMVLQDLQRATAGVHSQPEHGVVYVIAMVGRGPYKTEGYAKTTQEAMLIAEQLLALFSEYSVPPTLAPVKIPEIVSPEKSFDLIGVQVDGAAVGTTLPITDIHQLAHRSFAANRNKMIARAVARRIIKKGAVVTAKDQLEAQSSFASFAMDAAGVLWEATESADTRCWGLLPREIQLIRVELPAGTHTLALEPLTAATPVAAATSCQVQVADGRNTYVMGYWPDLLPVGELLVSQH